MQDLGIDVFIATTGWNPEQVNENPDVLSVMRDAGIREVRVTQLHSGGGYGQYGDIRTELDTARRIFGQCAAHAEKAGVRCVYQTHHRTLLPSASSLYPLLKGLDPRYFAGMLDGGNQPIEGFEDWVRSAKLMGEYLAGFGIKDAVPVRDPAKKEQPDKGWQWSMVSCREGVTDWGRVKEALEAVDFSGFFIFMPFYHRDDIQGMFRKTLKEERSFIQNIFS
jgi:sugar phosphate isomerase/epimerase